MERRDGSSRVTVQAKPVGQTRFTRLEMDAAAIHSQAELAKSLREHAGSDCVLDVRLVGVKPDGLDINIDELEKQLQSSFMHRVAQPLSVEEVLDRANRPEDCAQPADVEVAEWLGPTRLGIEDAREQSTDHLTHLRS